MATRTKAYPEGSDKKLLGLSVEVDELCEGILYESRRFYKLSIVPDTLFQCRSRGKPCGYRG